MNCSRTRAFRFTTMMLVLILIAHGCGPPSIRSTEPPSPSGELPPAYTRDKILDPKLLEVSRSITSWAAGQKVGTDQVFSRVEVLPPTPTLLPYGIGANQKETRLPAILITGPGWPSLKRDQREALVALVFSELARQIAAIKPEPAISPTVTIQTPDGLELAWVNRLEPGGKYLHGEQQ